MAPPPALSGASGLHSGDGTLACCVAEGIRERRLRLQLHLSLFCGPQEAANASLYSLNTTPPPRRLRPFHASSASCQVGLSDPECSGKCAPGYFCPSGSTSPFERKCGHVGVYCPLGSSEPSEILPGHYGIHAGPQAESRVRASGIPSSLSSLQAWPDIESRKGITFPTAAAGRRSCSSLPSRNLSFAL